MTFIYASLKLRNALKMTKKDWNICEKLRVTMTKMDQTYRSCDKVCVTI